MRIKNIPLAALTALLLMSCNNDELSRSNQQRDSLMSVLDVRDSSLTDRENALNEFIEAFNEVEKNLDCVAVKQQLIYSSSENSHGELRGTQRDKINAQINAINEMMDKNRQTISSLRKNLNRTKGQNKKLEASVRTLTEQIARKDEELAALNERLTALNLKVAQLQTTLDSTMALNTSQGQTIAESLAALHTAYYLVGRSKELRDANIIDRKGGLLGIGRTSRLNQNFDPAKFTKIDYTQTKSIPINSKQMRMVTTHPADSYNLERDPNDKNIVKTLEISNPERFWSVSKFLVIEGVPVKDKKEV